jgi:hypothetical protein
MNDIAILIDCWETLESKFKIPVSYDYKLFKNIKKFVETSDNITTIILASYQSVDEQSTIWHINSLRFLGEELYKFKNPHILKDVDPALYKQTDKIILDWVSEKYQLAMHFDAEFELFVRNNKIGNIYLCGKAMDMCIKDRPLGYESLTKLLRKHNLNSRIFVKDDCINDSKGNIFNLENYPEWIKTNDPTIFELKIV